MQRDALLGCLLGTAAGDAVGLPAEGLSRRRRQKLFGDIQRPRLFFGYGMTSDDTDHACMVACALATAQGDPARFAKKLGWMLRLWLLTIPAGIGFATLRGILKLWIGFSPDKSGVFSAGNGPAMRSAIIGVYCHDSLPNLKAFTRAATRLTHTDPKAEHGALAVALAARHAFLANDGSIAPRAYLEELNTLLGEEGAEFTDLMRQCVESILAGDSTIAFADALGLSKGVTGYVCHTVPVAVHAALRHAPDLRAAVLAVIACGGDTDTTAAITGGIVGAGSDALVPQDWIDKICLWPLRKNWVANICDTMLQQDNPSPHFPFLQTIPRNAIFLPVVLLHGFRRLFPPY